MNGPWSWAARMIREDLLVTTATLLGHDFARERWPYFYKDGLDMQIGMRTPIPKWAYAELWLSSEPRGIVITPTLQVIKR